MSPKQKFYKGEFNKKIYFIEFKLVVADGDEEESKPEEKEKADDDQEMSDVDVDEKIEGKEFRIVVNWVKEFNSSNKIPCSNHIKSQICKNFISLFTHFANENKER